MMYDNCNQCPRNNTPDCPFAHRSATVRSHICQFLRLPIKPLHDDTWIQKQAELLADKINNLIGSQGGPLAYPAPLQETEYGYEDFFYYAFAAETPDQQARHFQAVLVSAAAMADFKKGDITRCRFFVNDIGNARAEFPPENWLPE